MQNKQYFVYILANKTNSVMYIGVTGDLIGRVWQHKNKVVKSFSSRYNVNKLVYYEVYENPSEAIVREKRLKSWKREWKQKLINGMNSNWRDLYNKII